MMITKRAITLTALIFVLAMLLNRCILAEEDGAKYLIGKWNMDTEQYVFDITNGNYARNGLLFQNLTIHYEFSDDNRVHVKYFGNLVFDSMFPEEIVSGSAEWKNEGTVLTIGTDDYEMRIIDDTTLILTSDGKYPQITLKRFSPVDTSRTMKFGRFEQDGNVDNGAEEIEWYIIYENNDYILLLSKYALTTMPFDPDYSFTSYEESSLYHWLNTEFVSSFNEEERTQMLRMTIDDEDHTIAIQTDSEEYPYVTLMSLSDAQTYGGINNNLHLQYTDQEENDKVFSWLSTSGKMIAWPFVSVVEETDYIYQTMPDIDGSVRPMICIKANEE